MIRRKAEQKMLTRNSILGGEGEVVSMELLKPDEFCGKGRLFSRYILRPSSSFGEHTHEGDFEAYYILKGVATYYEDGQEHRLHAGDLTLTRDGESHSLTNNSDEDVEMLALVLFSK